jgi:RNA-directed DNA polymerase
VLETIRERFQACKLELHPDKTRVVYCRDINRIGGHPEIQFTFLGYKFRPRKAVDKYGRVYVNFSPAVSREALKAMRQTIRGWHLQLKSDKSLADLSAMFDPILRGWRDNRRKARLLLAKAYNWFTEGHDTWYLVEARALLKELAS